MPAAFKAENKEKSKKRVETSKKRKASVTGVCVWHVELLRMVAFASADLCVIE